MASDDVLGLLRNWELLRDATAPDAAPLFEPSPAGLALSFMAGRQEYWSAFVGMMDFARQASMDGPAPLFEQLHSGQQDELMARLARYGESNFAEPAPFVPAVRAIVSFVPPETLNRAASLAMSWGFCYQVCNGDPHCVAKCLKSRRGSIDEEPPP